MPNIFLIGPRACGKTSVGQALATQLGLSFGDTDHVFVSSVGMSIAEFISRRSWDAFREKECQVFKGLLKETGCVIGCGGGLVLREENQQLLRSGLTFYLKTDPEVLVARLRSDPLETQRPSLTGKSLEDEVRDVLEKRSPIYESCADVVLEQERLEDIVSAACFELKKRFQDF